MDDSFQEWRKKREKIVEHIRVVCIISFEHENNVDNLLEISGHEGWFVGNKKQQKPANND